MESATFTNGTVDMSNVKAMTYVQSIPLKGDGEGRRTPSTLGSRLDGPSGTGRREGVDPEPYHLVVRRVCRGQVHPGSVGSRARELQA